MPNTFDAMLNAMLGLDALLAPPPKRSKATKPPPPERPSTQVYSLVVGGRVAVSVPLTGATGRGKRMVLDEATWGRVAAVLGKDWRLQEAKPGVSYVVSTRVGTVKAAGEGASKVVRLARFVAGAKRGEVVTYRDGDPLNLTRGNLEVVSGAAFIDRTFGVARGA